MSSAVKRILTIFLEKLKNYLDIWGEFCYTILVIGV